MAIEPETYVARVEGLMTAPVDEELVILNLAGNNYVSLDSIGRRIWELLDSPIRVDELCRRVEKEYSGEQARIAADLLAFLTQLERDGLVRVSEV